MTPHWQTPRAGLLWLLIAQAAIAIGLWSVLPVWVGGLLVVSCLWRLQVYRGAWNFPGRLPKLLLVIVCGGGLVLTFDRLSGLEPLASLLVSAAAFKLLEMQRHRDGMVLVLVCYFSASLQLLFEQTMAVAAYTLLCFVLVTAALTGMFQSNRTAREKSSNWAPLRRSGVLVAQSLPLMVVLFLVLPRLPAFWAVPGQQQATTGISGDMSPGDISQLGKDDRLAFRASFETAAPPPSQLYWRGPVLTRFDGRRWRQLGLINYGDGSHINWSGEAEAPWRQRVDYYGGPLLEYTIILEATQQPWLFALMAPRRYSDDVGLTREMRLIRRRPANRKIQYSVSSSPQYRYFVGKLHNFQRRQALQLPAGYNPQAISLAQRWRSQSESDQAYIERVLDWYSREFTYTLQPPLLGQHSVDEFLWQTRRGFCEHFASSFVVLMRAGGIPARVVTGYQGAEQHPQEGYLLVHQYNAHAWAEVWQPEQGWVRVDPTAAVAPERIEQGFEAFFQQPGSDAVFSLARFRHIDWINQLRLKLDSLDYYWSKWVLGYNHQQQSLLTRLLGEANWQRIGLLLLGSGAVVVLFIMLWLLRDSWTSRRSDPVDRYFGKLCDKVARTGWPRRIGEGPLCWRQRLEREGGKKRIKNAENVILALRLYEMIRYADKRRYLEAFRREVNRV